MALVSSEPSYVFFSLIIVGAAILGTIFLLVLAFLVGRMTVVTMRSAGAVVLAMALILLISGLWCVFLSPSATYSETKESLYRPISLEGLGSWSNSFTIQEGDVIAGSVNERILYDSPANATKIFNIRIYDPSGNVVWFETNAMKSYFNVKASKAGTYRLEVQNPARQPTEYYIQVTISATGTCRPLEPFGQWLSLISLPVLGLGVWASGLFVALRRE